MDNVTIFNSPEFGDIRTVTIDNEPWFVGKDVATALGYANPKNAVPAHVDDDDKLNTQIEYADQKRTVTVINESGLYSLILSSKLPSAKRFKHWVTSEVLPAIRKTGFYGTTEFINKALNNPDVMIEMLQEIKRQREENVRLGDEILARQQIIETMQPKADYYDKILSSTDTVSVTQIAKDYGMSPQDLNQLLNEIGVQYKVNGQWVLYQKHSSYGYTKSQTFFNHKTGYTGMQTRWTQKGRLFLYEKLKGIGYLPVIERT